MMESEIKNQNDLLQKLKTLQAEKELLEKHVFVLNECLSVEELKAKISNLEKKKEKLVSLENIIGRLRAEIEPLNYLKTILQTKLVDENKIHSNNVGSELGTVLEARADIEPLKYLNTISTTKSDVERKIQSNNIGSASCIDIKSYTRVPKLNKELQNSSSVDFKLVQPVGFKTSISQSVQNIPTDSGKNNLALNPEFKNVNPINTFQTPILYKSNSISTENDGSLDECMQLLDQYDVVTDQEILNFPTEENDLKSQSVDQEPTNIAIDVENEVQDTKTTYCFDAEANLQSHSQVPIKKSVELCLNNSVNSVSVTCENLSTKIHEASTSQPTQNKESLCLDSNVNIGDVTCENLSNKIHEASTSQPTQNKENLCSNSNIGDLLLKIPQLLLQQGVDYIQDEKVNQSLKNVNVSTNVSSEEHNKHNMKNELNTNLSNELNKLLIDYTIQLENNYKAMKNNVVSSNQTESDQHDELPPDASNFECSINSFNDMNLKIDILRGLYSLGFVNPTTLQQHTVMHCIHGRDIIVFAGPGNGRTMMFTIPLLQRIKTNLNECQALVLVPTRPLAVHIQKIIMSVGDFLGVNVCIGGDNVPRKLSIVPHIVVGTPAGVTNMISCKSLHTESIQTVVINKAEKMLTNNYTILIEEIIGKLTRTRQITLLASDKLDHVLDIYMGSLCDPLIFINDQDKAPDLLNNLPKQFYLNIQKEWKMNALCEIIETLNIQKSIIFCNTLDRAQKLCESLQGLEYAASLFHLEMNAHERDQILDMFSSNYIKMLITTDPINGSQFQQPAWIINYDLPINPICYLNRVTKCAENIKVINLIDENESEDQKKLAIEAHIKCYMIQMPLNMIDLLQY